MDRTGHGAHLPTASFVRACRGASLPSPGPPGCAMNRAIALVAALAGMVAADVTAFSSCFAADARSLFESGRLAALL